MGRQRNENLRNPNITDGTVPVVVLRAKIGRYPRDAPVLLHLVQLGIEFRDVNSSGSLQPQSQSSRASRRRGFFWPRFAREGFPGPRFARPFSLLALSLGRASRDPLPNLGT